MAIRVWIIFVIIFILIALGILIFLIIKFLLTPSSSTSVYDAPGMSDLPEPSGDSSSSPSSSQPQNNLQPPATKVESLHEEPMLNDSPPLTTSSISGESYCPYCGTELDEPDSSFCPNCGAQLSE
ncbi:MAG: zinc-ribbon domain-containing protein [Candidatus Heimdallarchaeota archaeon]|nr:zinc-ribbon domain-containing protein [Candidatus Heimdallarchaeota archaeon]